MIIIVDLIRLLFNRQLPKLKEVLRTAHLDITPRKFIKKIMFFSFYSAAAVTILLFFMFEKFEVNLSWLVLVFFGTLFVVFGFMKQTPRVYISRRQKEIDREVLFAGRYLLVKLESGTPLFNSLIDASNSYGVGGKYFKEIVDEINLGTPIEDALESARRYNSSEKFKLILSELITALKTGVESSSSLRSVLQQITKEEVIEITRYARKLNAFMMLYMVLATVIPSLGMTIFVIISGFMSLELSPAFMFLALFVLVFIQFMFLSIIKSARPLVNI